MECDAYITVQRAQMGAGSEVDWHVRASWNALKAAAVKLSQMIYKQYESMMACSSVVMAYPEKSGPE